jgi:hypothetical protein
MLSDFGGSGVEKVVKNPVMFRWGVRTEGGSHSKDGKSLLSQRPSLLTPEPPHLSLAGFFFVCSDRTVRVSSEPEWVADERTPIKT